MDTAPKKGNNILAIYPEHTAVILGYPRRIAVGTANQVLNHCQQARDSQDKTIVFELQNTVDITPFGIVILAGTISECLAQKKDVKYGEPHSEDTKKFLSGIGFNDFFHIPGKKHKIEKPQFQLKRIFSIDTLLTEKIVVVFDYAVKMSEGLKGSLTMAITEMMTNAFDHSGSKRGCYVCAQAYENLIRLCVADFGIGLYARLVPKYSDKIQNSYGAIKLAVKEGVTTRPFGGKGLRHIQRFIEVNNGRMSILSGDGKAVWDFGRSRSKLRKQILSLPFGGTIINLEINRDQESLYFLKDQEGQIF